MTDIPKRRHKSIRYVDEAIRLKDYEGTIRQLAVTGLGREEPVIFHPEVSHSIHGHRPGCRLWLATIGL